jgi:amidohydrolase
MTESVIDVANLAPIRHYLHAHPELSECEVQTAAYVAEQLSGMDLWVQTGVGGHGLVVDIVGARPGKTLAIRADMDALPIEERNEVEYRSQNPGRMHACGHDGHTTILLGTARALLDRRDNLAGNVRLLFQPAEETTGGARRMCAEGALSGVDAVVALHGWPGLEVGRIGVRDHAMMASADTFDIVIKGAQAHAAYPHLSHDPIVTAAQLILALQTIASREVNPNDPVVVTVAQVHSGTAYNIIPELAIIKGTVRTLNRDTRASMPERLRRIAEGICAASLSTCEFTWHEGTGPVLNDPGVNDVIRKAAHDILGHESVEELAHSSMGAEDFSEYLEHAPGAMFRLGLGNISALHTPTFNFTDAALPIGVQMFVRIAEEYLNS